uniref:Uncharacterized protein n=1 Tax=Ascaris lumbricoides TaxID=6252 RepID=A0A0M3IEJ6_ASCLU
MELVLGAALVKKRCLTSLRSREGGGGRETGRMCGMAQMLSHFFLPGYYCCRSSPSGNLCKDNGLTSSI